MADDTIDRRLAAIEAALPTLATKADLEKIELELVKSDEKLGAVQVSLDNLHAEVRTLSGFMRGMAIAGVALSESVDNLRDRLDRLEKRGEA